MDYVAEQIDNIPAATKFLECFRQAAVGPQRPVRQVATPNDQPRGPPETNDDKKINALREEISQRFKKHLEKAKNQDVSSTSESEAPKRKIQPKPMPKKQKSTAGTVESAEASDSKSAASAVSTSARSPWGHRRAVIRSAARREASTQAKELFKDAEAAQKFYSKFKKETDAIEWYQRPTGPQCCSNFNDCGCAEAMFWCHPCGLAFCLECRTSGLACDHNIINYSSELSSDFLPDSISSTNSPFDIGVLIDAVLAESSYFGATRLEHAHNRQESYQDLIQHLKEGRTRGNSYLQSFAKHGIENFDYTGFIYRMDGANRVPTLQEHYIDAQDETPLPIWRPMVYLKYPEGPDLTETEILRLLELFRSCLLGKRAVQGVVKRTKENIHEFQRDTYQLGILTLNLGHINRVPYIGGSSKFPKGVRTDTKYRVLPHLVFRNAAHIVCFCEASDEYGGIAIHRDLAKEYGMIGMVVHPAISSQSLAIFIRGDHYVGSFIELLGHHQHI